MTQGTGDEKYYFDMQVSFAPIAGTPAESVLEQLSLC
jgi:hypothetical protein